MRVLARDIGRVGDDQVVAVLRRQGLVPVARQAAPPRAQPLRVTLGHRQRGRAQVGGRHLGLRATQRHRHGDGAAAGAQVQHARRSAALQPMQRRLHQQLGIRARNQHIRRQRVPMPHELAPAQQIGHGLASQAARRQLPPGRLVRGLDRVGIVRQQPGARAAQHVLGEHARLQPGQARVGQQVLEQGHRPRITDRGPAPPVARPGARPAARRSARPGRLP
ncbi:Uncharacterised protein [Bordetella pertussis]|nr:Uncharacterised protein [Bordetella pertussis]